MFASERLGIIKGLLIDKKHINVSDLSSMLNVSEVTIRRDLEKLENEDFLTRTHGGAVINTVNTSEEENYIDNSINSKLNNQIKELKNIIKILANLL